MEQLTPKDKALELAQDLEGIEYAEKFIDAVIQLIDWNKTSSEVLESLQEVKQELLNLK